MWRENFVNANPATIMQRLYQLKAEQDGQDVVIIARAEKRTNLPDAGMGRLIKAAQTMKGSMENENLQQTLKSPCVQAVF